MKILILEVSTSAAKAIIYDNNTDEKFSHQIKYSSKISDVKTQDIEAVYSVAIKCCEELIKREKIYDIDIVSFGSVWHSYILLDENRIPLGRVKTWANTEAAAFLSEYKNDKDVGQDLYQKTGCTVHSKYPCWKWLHDSSTINLSKYKKVSISSVPEYIFEKLTGETVISKSVASGTGYFNIHTLTWDSGILDYFKIDKNQLSTLKEHDYYGYLCDSVADKLGLKRGIKVVIPGPDGANNQIGDGALKDNIMTMSIGTSSAIRLANDTPVLPKEPATWCYYIGDNIRIVGASIAAGGNSVDWFMNNVLMGKASFDDLEKALLSVDIINAPIFLPFIDGEQSPGWGDSRLGSFCNLSSKHNVYDMYYSLLEGVLFNLYHCYTFLIDIMDKPKEIKLSGGIIHSNFWMQMVADLFAIPITISISDHASMMGALAIAKTVIGSIGSISEFNSGGGEKINPKIDKQPIYANRFKEYLECYYREIDIPELNSAHYK